MPQMLIGRDYGDLDQLDVIDADLAGPGPGEVLVSVRAAGVNPADLKKLAGQFGRSETRPIPLGMEVAGVVTAATPGATGPAGPIQVGDEVLATGVNGAFASDIVVPASKLVPKPASLDWHQAAGLLLTGTTAWHLLESTSVAAGDRVLVHGASGAVGVAVMQLARERGAEVVGTASPRNHALLERFGAKPVAYGEGLADRVRAIWPEGPTVALDTVGTDEAIDVSVQLVADRQRIATIAGWVKGTEAGILMLGGGPGADPGTQIRNEARLPLVELAGAGKLEVVVGATFPLARGREALELSATRHADGKIVILP